MQTLTEYYDQLNRHDWYFEFSDDHRVWKAGTQALSELRGLAHQSPEHLKLYEGFSKHMFSGEAWRTEKQPKPERPT